MPHAIRFEKTGGPEVLQWQEVAVDDPGPGEARIAHKAIGLNYIDTYHRTGLYPLPLPSGIGLEAAGVVEAVGAGVTEFKAGDRVAYCNGPIGAYSETKNHPVDRLVKLPDGVSFEQGACMMLQGLTAHYLLRRLHVVPQAGDFILWVPLTLVIESSVIPLRIIFEHRFYLPSIGLVGLLALVVHRVLERHPLSRWFVFVMTLALTILLSASTVKRIAVWRDDPTLWGDVLKKYPCSAEAHNALGTYSWRRGLVRKARDHYLAALQCDPRHRQAVLNLARAYRDLGDFANAIEAYRNASVLRPNDPTVRFSLGLAYLETGMGTLAAEEFRKVLEMDPNHPHARGFLEFASSLDSRSPHGIVSPHP